MNTHCMCEFHSREGTLRMPWGNVNEVPRARGTTNNFKKSDVRAELSWQRSAAIFSLHIFPHTVNT